MLSGQRGDHSSRPLSASPCPGSSAGALVANALYLHILSQDMSLKQQHSYLGDVL